MGLLHTFFAAESDEQAVTAAEHGPEQLGFDAVDLPDLDPSTTLATVEAQLLGSDEEFVSDRPRFADLIGDAGGSWVFTVTDELQQAIAAAAPRRLADIAAIVLGEDEDEEGMPVDDREFAVNALTGLLNELSDLSRRAIANDLRLYAWVSL